MESAAIIVRSNNNCRVLLCSIPKSGTYLASEFLSNVGVAKTGLHISANEYSDYRSGSRDEHRSIPEKFRVEAGVEDSLKLIGPNHHAVSHLAPDERVRSLLDQLGLHVLFLYRDLRDCSISYMRFLADTGRDQSHSSSWIHAEDPRRRYLQYVDLYHWFFQAAAPICQWLHIPGVVAIRYEDLVGDFGPDVQFAAAESVCRELRLTLPKDEILSALSSALSAATLTRSSQRTNRAEFWSAEAELRFEQLGGLGVNALLGYV